MKSIFSQAREFMGVETSKPLVEGMAVVFVWYAKSKHRVFIDIGAAVSAFQVHLYLATGVMPSRQKLVGFEGISVPCSSSGAMLLPWHENMFLHVPTCRRMAKTLKICTGCAGGSGPSAALQPNADLATMNVRDGMELRLTQLPYGQVRDASSMSTVAAATDLHPRKNRHLYVYAVVYVHTLCNVICNYASGPLSLMRACIYAHCAGDRSPDPDDTRG
jgi:hypothetical protein